MSSLFGPLLKEIREKNKKTQTDIADIVGKTTMYISNIENGKNGPLKDKDLDQLLTALDANEEERSKLKCAAIIESRKIPAEMATYFLEKPESLELVIMLCTDNADEKSLSLIKTYYEKRIRR